MKLVIYKKDLKIENNIIQKSNNNKINLLRAGEKKFKNSFSLCYLKKSNNYKNNFIPSISLNYIQKTNFEINSKKPFIFGNKLIKNAFKKENNRLIDKEREKIKKKKLNIEEEEKNNFPKKKNLSYNDVNSKDHNKFYPQMIKKIKLKNDINWKNFFSNKSFSNKKLMNIMSKLRIFS